MVYVLLALIGLWILLDIQRSKKMAEDFSKLQASIAKLQTDVSALIAAKEQNNQAAIDAAQVAVDAVDSTVVAATPPTA
jgi:cell division protein FtsB